MSAYTVSEKHITAMVNSMRHTDTYYWNGERHPLGSERQEVAQKLWNENFRSVNYRYNESEEAPEYTGTSAARRFSPIDIVKLCHGYNYQTCETPDWEETEAYAISQAIEARAIRRVTGYEDAPWSV